MGLEEQEQGRGRVHDGPGSHVQEAGSAEWFVTHTVTASDLQVRNGSQQD